MADRPAGIPRFELFSYWRADCQEWEIFVFFPRHLILKNF
jgi:hypothetical protein